MIVHTAAEAKQRAGKIRGAQEQYLPWEDHPAHAEPVDLAELGGGDVVQRCDAVHRLPLLHLVLPRSRHLLLWLVTVCLLHITVCCPLLLLLQLLLQLLLLLLLRLLFRVGVSSSPLPPVQGCVSGVQPAPATAATHSMSAHNDTAILHSAHQHSSLSALPCVPQCQQLGSAQDIS